MASLLFGDAIDYARVRIHNRPYLPFGLQPKNCAMAPNGSIYFHHSCFLPDYSAGDLRARHWFMHEMAHVWQHQLGYPVRLRGAIRIGLAYRYELHEGARLADYNMEAQAELLADYFAFKHLGRPPAGQLHSMAMYESALAHFLPDPASRANLPRGVGTRLLRQ